jgi:hypothetical protein
LSGTGRRLPSITAKEEDGGDPDGHSAEENCDHPHSTLLEHGLPSG